MNARALIRLIVAMLTRAGRRRAGIPDKPIPKGRVTELPAGENLRPGDAVVMRDGQAFRAKTPIIIRGDLIDSDAFSKELAMAIARVSANEWGKFSATYRPAFPPLGPDSNEIVSGFGLSDAVIKAILARMSFR